jgi:hypothetical protein
MTGKFSVDIVGFRPMDRNTLVGFATVRINEMRLHDVAIHARADSRWAQLPAKPQLDPITRMRRRSRGVGFPLRLG